MKRRDVAKTTGEHVSGASVIGRLRRASRRRLRALRSDETGATAIEFGIVALLFFGMIFAIIELSIIFFTGAVLSNAVTDTGRDIRVGRFSNCGGAAEFKALVCSRMKNLMNCKNALRVDVMSSSGFRTIVMPDLQSPEDEDSGASFEVEDGDFEPGLAETPGIPVNVRATFYYKNMLPTHTGRKEDPDGTGTVDTLRIPRGYQVIRAVTAFRSEPFDPNSSCDSDLQEEIDSTQSPPPAADGAS